MSLPPRRYALSEVQLTSTGTSDTKSAAAPTGADHVLLSVETNDARVTLANASTPSSSQGHVLPKTALPLYLPVGESTTVRVVSTAAGNCTLNITWFCQ